MKLCKNSSIIFSTIHFCPVFMQNKFHFMMYDMYLGSSAIGQLLIIADISFRNFTTQFHNLHNGSATKSPKVSVAKVEIS